MNPRSMKKASSGTTTVKVSVGTKEKLKKEKKKRRLKSVDEVISVIVDELNESDREDEVEEEPENNEDRPRQRRKKLVRDAFYTYEAVAERDGMVQYLTSLTVSEVDMVISRFQEMVQHSFSFLFFFFAVASASGFVMLSISSLNSHFLHVGKRSCSTKPSKK